MKKLFNEVLHFGMIGVFNTLLGYALIMLFYNIFHWNYWVSSGTSYVIGSFFSFFANRKLTFHAEGDTMPYAVRFSINVVVCYFIAYGVAKPLVRSILLGYSKTIVENIALLVGICLFIVLNFLGQKFFVFHGKKEEKESETECKK